MSQYNNNNYQHSEQMAKAMESKLGAKIKSLRKEKGFTLDKLANLTESSKSYIWELENKSPPRPSANKLSRIAEQLGTTMEFLLDENDTVDQGEAADAHFYREYKSLTPETKEKIRKIARLWDG